MSKPRFTTPQLQTFYLNCRKLAADRTSEFWYSGEPHRGATHRAAYWNGRAGMPYSIARITPNDRRTFRYAAWAAGADDFRNFGPVANSGYRHR